MRDHGTHLGSIITRHFHRVITPNRHHTITAHYRHGITTMKKFAKKVRGPTANGFPQIRT